MLSGRSYTCPRIKKYQRVFVGNPNPPPTTHRGNRRGSGATLGFTRRRKCFTFWPSAHPTLTRDSRSQSHTRNRRARGLFESPYPPRVSATDHLLNQHQHPLKRIWNTAGSYFSPSPDKHHQKQAKMEHKEYHTISLGGDPEDGRSSTEVDHDELQMGYGSSRQKYWLTAPAIFLPAESATGAFSASPAERLGQILALL